MFLNFEDHLFSIFCNILYCAICGLTKLTNKALMTLMNTKVQNWFGTILGCTWYRTKNYFMAKYTTNAINNFMSICSKYKLSDNHDDYYLYIVTMNLEYLSSLLKLNPLSTNGLFLGHFDTTRRPQVWLFLKINDTSLLNSPMLWGNNIIDDL